MHSNLTAADVAKYVNAKILLFGNVLNQVAINFKEQELMLISESGSHGYWSNVSDCHLLLKPLSELSKDDAYGIITDTWRIVSDWGRIIRCSINKDNEISIEYERTRYTTRLSIATIDYLRSKGYDMDNFLTTNKAKHA